MTWAALVVACLALVVSLTSVVVARTAHLRAKAATRVVQTSTTPSGVVTFDGPLSGEDFRRFREEWERRAASTPSPLTDAQADDFTKRFLAAWASPPRRPL